MSQSQSRLLSLQLREPLNPVGNERPWRSHNESSNCQVPTRGVLRSQLTGKSKVLGINTYDLPVIGYPTGIRRWPTKEMGAADTKTRKILAMHGAFHSYSSTQRPPREPGRLKCQSYSPGWINTDPGLHQAQVIMCWVYSSSSRREGKAGTIVEAFQTFQRFHPTSGWTKVEWWRAKRHHAGQWH